MLVGLIADTHSLLRPEALSALAGVEMILHAGDVGRFNVLRELHAIAPVQAVAGNIDGPELGLPPRLFLTLDGLNVIVTHGHEFGSPTPEALAQAYPADVVVYGHTHVALVETVESRLIVNPGAAGPARFNLKPSVALLRIDGGKATVEIVQMENH